MSSPASSRLRRRPPRAAGIFVAAILVGMRIGVAHHLGWAVVVTASADHEVVDRRRIDLLEPGVSAAPIHHDGGPHALHRPVDPLDDAALAALVAEVRASARRTSAAALDELASALPGPVVSMSLRAWPPDFPTEISVLRQVPYESRADSVMDRQVLAEVGEERGWSQHLYDGKTVEAESARLLGERADEVLHGPRRTLGPPCQKGHRVALAATILAGAR